MITGIKHMAIAVRDVNAALKKYEDMLGPRDATRHEFEKARSSEGRRPTPWPCTRSMVPSAIAFTTSKLAAIPDSPSTPSRPRASAPSPCCR